MVIMKSIKDYTYRFGRVLLSVCVCVFIQLFNIAALCLRSQQEVRRLSCVSACSSLRLSCSTSSSRSILFKHARSPPAHLQAHERPNYCQ